MSATVDPAHAHLPLPGGKQGAGVTVQPLRCGEALAPPGMWDRRPGRIGLLQTLLTPRSKWRWIPLPVFLVEHPSAGVILIDTGLHTSAAVDPGANLGPVLGRMQSVRLEREDAAPEALAARGIDPEDVRIVIMTHLHFDHAGSIPEFPEATFVVDRAEWDAATAGGSIQGYHSRQFDHAFDWQMVDFESRAVDSFAGFGRALDLLGDGSIRLLSTPGHTPGHMSVLLRLRSGRELLVCGDAAYSLESLQRDMHPLAPADLHLYRRSVREIRLFMQQTPSAIIVPGHDPEAWAQLEPSYA